jgi:hypothetical protein
MTAALDQLHYIGRLLDMAFLDKKNIAAEEADAAIEAGGGGGGTNTVGGNTAGGNAGGGNTALAGGNAAGGNPPKPRVLQYREKKLAHFQNRSLAQMNANSKQQQGDLLIQDLGTSKASNKKKKKKKGNKCVKPSAQVKKSPTASPTAIGYSKQTTDNPKQKLLLVTTS